MRLSLSLSKTLIRSKSEWDVDVSWTFPPILTLTPIKLKSQSEPLTINPNSYPIAIRLTLTLAPQDRLRTFGYSIGQLVYSKITDSQDGWKIVPGIKGKVLGVEHSDDEKVLVEFDDKVVTADQVFVITSP